MAKSQMRNPDDPFDENGLLRDGHSFRVDIKLTDSKKPATRQHLVDGTGDAGLGLNKPGFRNLVGGNARTTRPGRRWTAPPSKPMRSTSISNRTHGATLSSM